MAAAFVTFQADDGLRSSKGVLSCFIAEHADDSPQAYRPAAGSALVNGTLFCLA